MSSFIYHDCGMGFVGCPGDASLYADMLLRIWDDLPLWGAKPKLYHWHKHYDPFSHSAAQGGQFQIESTHNPTVNPVFILFGQIIGSPVRPPSGDTQWAELRSWLDSKGWGSIALAGTDFPDPSVVPAGKVPLSGTMYELFGALRSEDTTGHSTHLRVYDLSALIPLPDDPTPEFVQQSVWCRQLLDEFGKNRFVFRPRNEEEFRRQVVIDLKDAYGFSPLDPMHDELPSMAAVAVDEPLLFARESAIEDLTRRIITDGAALTRLIGVSGAGKSSVLRAGLMGSWFNLSRGASGLRRKVTAVLAEPLQLGGGARDPLVELGRLMVGEREMNAAGSEGQQVGTVGPLPAPIACCLPELAPPCGERQPDLVAARTWWDQLAAHLPGPFVLMLDQAEQIDAIARAEARGRVERDASADPHPFLAPRWQRFVDLVTTLAGIGDPTLGMPMTRAPSGDAPFRMVLGLHRSSAIDLWQCDREALRASSTYELAPFGKDKQAWTRIIEKTVMAYGLTLAPAMVDEIAGQATKLAKEHKGLHEDSLAEVEEDTSFTEASVLPLIKVTLQLILSSWREAMLASNRTNPSESDRQIVFEIGEGFVSKAANRLGEIAIAAWVDEVMQTSPRLGLFEKEALDQDLLRRFDHLFMGLIDVGYTGNAELSYIARSGDLAKTEGALIEALREHRLLTSPDGAHWRLPHRTVIDYWARAGGFIERYNDRLTAKRRLLTWYNVPLPASTWPEAEPDAIVALAFSWIGNDEGGDALLHDYLRSGLTARFDPACFALDAPNLLAKLPLLVLGAGDDAWSAQLLGRAMAHPSWLDRAWLWTLVLANGGRTEALGKVLASLTATKLEQALCQFEPNTGVFPLLVAAQYGHESCVAALLAAGADANAVSASNGAFPLLMAAETGYEGCVAALLAAGADANAVNADDGTFPLLMAAQRGHAGCVAALLAAGADANAVNAGNGAFPLLMATQEGFEGCVAALLAAGASANTVHAGSGAFPLLMAAEKGFEGCVAALLAAGADVNTAHAGSGIFSLLMAAQNGHEDCVAALLAAGADANAIHAGSGTFPLLLAAQGGYEGCVAALLAAGAHANAVNADNGTFPLLLASQQGHEGCVAALLAAGADANAVDAVRGTFPLLMAAHNGYEGCLAALLAAGADANAVDAVRGTFPLLMAAEKGFEGCIMALLAAGADANTVHAGSGNFSLLIAAQQGHEGCVAALLAAGADANAVSAGSGNFSLMMAAQQGHAGCVAALLAAGANPCQLHAWTGATALLVAALKQQTLVVRMLGHLPGTRDLLPADLPDVSEFVDHILELDTPAIEESVEQLERSGKNNHTSQDDGEPRSVFWFASPLPLPCKDQQLGNEALHQRVLEAVTRLIGDAAGQLFAASNVAAWSLNPDGDQLVQVTTRPDAESAMQVLAINLPRHKRTLLCRPGINLDDVARSMANARRPLALDDPDAAQRWAALWVLVHGGNPILEDATWLPDLAVRLPETVWEESYWRAWRFSRLPQGPAVALPCIVEDKVVRVQVLVPTDGIGMTLICSPETILSGLPFRVPGFAVLNEGEPPSALWLARSK